MSDEAARAAERQARERREGDLVAFRIKELVERPIQGRFDTAHLKAVHAYIFQDLLEHRPGTIRRNTDSWRKARELEGHGPTHVVHYLHRGIEGRINRILRDFGGPPALLGLPIEQIAARLAGLYGDLDYAHAFYEGNSRTLREFTRQLSLAAGLTLDWVQSRASAETRNALYIARDVAVLERAFPGLDETRAMATEDRAEYQAWWHLEKLREMQGEHSLELIILNALRPDHD